MLTVFALLALAAFLCAVAAAMARAPLWVSVMMLCVIELLRVIPLGR